MSGGDVTAEERFSPGFRLLLGTAPGLRVLEASADRGARARALRALGTDPLCLRASATEAQALAREGFAAATPGTLAIHPRLDAALLSVALGRTRGGEWTAGGLEALLAAALPALAPGAPVVLAIPNPLYAWPLLGTVLDRLRDRSGGALRGGPPWAAADDETVRERIEAAGLREVRVFGALPDGERLKFLLPLGSAAAVEYFFRCLVPRPRTAPRRLAARAAALLAGAGLLGRLVPHFEVAARVAAPPEGAGVAC